MPDWCHAPGMKEVGDVSPKKHKKDRVLLKFRKTFNRTKVVEDDNSDTEFVHDASKAMI